MNAQKVFKLFLMYHIMMRFFVWLEGTTVETKLFENSLFISNLDRSVYPWIIIMNKWFVKRSKQIIVWYDDVLKFPVG